MLLSRMAALQTILFKEEVLDLAQRRTTFFVLQSSFLPAGHLSRRDTPDIPHDGSHRWDEAVLTHRNAGHGHSTVVRASAVDQDVRTGGERRPISRLVGDDRHVVRNHDTLFAASVGYR